MPGKVIPCALCQAEAATVFCVNDDAHLCTSCDASVHAANPLLSRHERRPLAALDSAGECASAAQGSPASTDCGDVAVVPQLTPVAAAPAPAAPVLAHLQTAAPAFDAALAAPSPPPLALYEDSFFARSLTTSDLLDLDGDDLELPGCGSTAGGFAVFDPLDDCVVPSFGAADRFVPTMPSAQQPSFMQQPASYVPQYMQQQAVPQPQKFKLVPFGSSAAAKAMPMAMPQQTDAEAEAARVQRHRERQRKKRAFGRSVRYQSRRAYAEIRPRIKGRFVTPEEYAQYQAQMAAANGEQLGGMEGEIDGEDEGHYMPGADAVVPHEDDAVVPAAPSFVMA